MGDAWRDRVDRFVSFDLETHPIQPGLLAPPIVCGSWAHPDGSAGLLYPREAALDYAERILRSDTILVGANIAFDMGCLVVARPRLKPLVFAAYREGRVFDVQIAQALDAVAGGHLFCDPVTFNPVRGRYSLERCVSHVLGRDDAKVNDEWRLRYAELEGLPLENWPEEARQYPVDDARNTLEVARAQVLGGGHGPTPGPHRNLSLMSQRAELHWAMHLDAMWGYRVDPEAVTALRRGAEEAMEILAVRRCELGLERADGKLDRVEVKRRVIRAYSIGEPAPCAACSGTGKVPGKSKAKRPPAVNCADCSGTGLDPGGTPRTDGNGVSMSRDTLAESGDHDLAELGDNAAEAVLSRYMPYLETGLEAPITPRPNPVLATLRTSYDGVIQLLPREPARVVRPDGSTITLDVRGAHVARLGTVWCSGDYSAIELCTLAQVCLWTVGWSQMAETINASGDPGALHTAMAARIVGVTAEELAGRLKSEDPDVKAAAKTMRQAAKACNFGLPGGMGAAKLVLAKRKRAEGTTTLPDGTELPGLRFCVLLGGAERCGVEKVTEWKDRTYPPICLACLRAAEDLRNMWFEQWPEMRHYFSWVSARVEATGTIPFFTPDESYRGGVGFTDGANNGFQHLAALGGTDALIDLNRECHLDRVSPLWGSRPLFFVHDEVVTEMPLDRAPEAGDRMAAVMVAAMRRRVPDVCVVVEPALMLRWDKRVETVRDTSGRLQIWTPPA